VIVMKRLYWTLGDLFDIYRR